MAHRFPASDCSTAGVSRRSSPFRVRRTVGLSLNSAPGAGEPMDQAGNPDERDSSVVAVAAVSLVAGLACTLAPAADPRSRLLPIRLMRRTSLSASFALSSALGSPTRAQVRCAVHREPVGPE